MLTEAQRDQKQEGNRRWYERNRDRRLLQMRRYTWAWSLRRRYGLAPEDYAALLKAQGGRCALCGEKKPLQVEHDHRRGIGNRKGVRGLACARCNNTLYRLVEKPGLSDLIASANLDACTPGWVRQSVLHLQRVAVAA